MASIVGREKGRDCIPNYMTRLTMLTIDSANVLLYRLMAALYAHLFADYYSAAV